mmetsp:Transcript_2750/g.5576  ORF Transcript_2750/g.5576 Transcript_2750/m.5576 type:complete len:272 (-) Transcript_2750:1601-2416(-)
MNLSLRTSLLLALLCSQRCVGFSSHHLNTQNVLLTPLGASSKFGNDENFLMDEYRDPSTGEIMDPYKILKVSRKAERQEIKAAYRGLSRRYHPDMMLNRDIMPGSCNNLEDVRDHWERVKLSYEILSDPKSRKRYDRHEALADPGKAVQRAASEAAVGAAVSVGKGIWGLGSSVFQSAAKAATQARKETEKKQKMKMQSSATGNSSRIVKKRRPEIDPEMRRRHLELAYRSKIEDTLEASRSKKGSSLFSQTDAKANLRTLPSLGMHNDKS